jgi:O-antigen/teichoic acid export membrane protein
VRGLFGRDLLYVLLWAAQIGAVALFTPITTRLLGPSRYGQAAVAVALMQVLFAVGTFQLQTAIQRAHARNGEQAARVLISLAIVIALITLAVADLTGPLWSPLTGGHGYTATIRYAVMWAALSAVTNAGLGLIRSRDRLGQFAIVSFAQSVFAEAVAVGLVFLVRRTASEYVFGQMAAQAMAMGLALCFARPILPRWRDAAIVTGALRYSAALVPAALGVFVIDVSDRFVIHGDLGSAAVGRYAVARNVGGLAIMLLVALNNAWMPRVFRLPSGALRRAVLGASRNAIYAMLIPAMLGWTLVSPLLLELFAPASYRPEGLVRIVVLISVTSFPAAAAASATRVILCSGRTAPLGTATVLAAAVNLGLNFLLVPILGIEGSALATLIAYTVRWALLALVAARVARLPALPVSLLLGMLASIGAEFALAELPNAGPLVALRVVLGGAALITFAALAGSLAMPERFGWAARAQTRLGLSLASGSARTAAPLVVEPVVAEPVSEPVLEA